MTINQARSGPTLYNRHEVGMETNINGNTGFGPIKPCNLSPFYLVEVMPNVMDLYLKQKKKECDGIMETTKL